MLREPICERAHNGLNGGPNGGLEGGPNGGLLEKSRFSAIRCAKPPQKPPLHIEYRIGMRSVFPARYITLGAALAGPTLAMLRLVLAGADRQHRLPLLLSLLHTLLPPFLHTQVI
jgi:hypothetical protein